jgi:phosphatidate cytidylyltransferase
MTPPHKSNASLSGELRLRIISACVLAALALLSIWFGGIFFQAFWGLTAFLCFLEWINISIPGVRPLQYIIASFMVVVFSTSPISFTMQFFTPKLLMGAGLSLAFACFFAPSGKRVWAGAGLVYVTSFVFSIVLLRNSPTFGFLAVCWLCSIVWLSDMTAFFTGRTLGGPKLMPKISPKKTWSGFIGGTIGGILASYIVLILAGTVIKWQHLALAAVLSLAVAAGDLFESAFKRHFNVKDSGSLIPGHGGVLDRADGLIAAAIIAVIIGLIRNNDPAIGLLQW